MSFDIAYLKAQLEQRQGTKKSDFGESGKGKNELKWYGFPPDKASYKIRFLPPWTLEGGTQHKLPGIVITTHYGIPEVGKVLCYRTHGLDCPFCDMLRDYQDKISIEDWKPSPRAYFNVLVLEDNKSSPVPSPGTPYILGAGEFTLDWLIRQIITPDVGDITDPEKGHNVTFTRVEHKGKFERVISLKPTPIADTKEGIDAILTQMFNLSAIWRKPDDEYHKKMLNAIEKTKQMINTRLLGLKDGTPTLTPTTPSEVATAAAKSQPMASNKPKDSPECFGNTNPEALLANGEKMHHYQTSNKICLMCPVEFQCGEDIKKRKAI